MAASQENALYFVSLHCGARKAASYRDYGVTDFLGFYKEFTEVITKPEIQKTWALFLKWYERKDPGGGAAYQKSVDFNYKDGADNNTAPTMNVDKQAAGAKAAQLKGFGQCNYFAEMAYGLLKKPAVGKMTGKGPRVKKVSTPNHNWVIVNHDGPKADWVVVDLWLLALGVPYDKCVCLASKAAVAFYEKKITGVLEWDPNTLQERVLQA